MTIQGSVGLSILAALLAALVYTLLNPPVTWRPFVVWFVTFLVFALVLLTGPTLTIQVGR
jgi:uncharacterized protein (DUF983 family)